jgi:hypothetical protein
MKILESKYPMGSLKGQKTAGRYIDETLYENLKILAKSIGKDMTFLGVVSSSTLEVGTGKSTFVQHIAEAWTSLVNEYYGLNYEVTMKNIIFKPKDLIKRAFQLPKYSCIILDEWEDMHYWSELGISLRQFFRKCRQLNLFILIIIPNFFQLNSNYAISRSVFFIDVKFAGEFERGYFSFFNFQKKKDLYIRGKKTQDYGVVYPNFSGRFTDGYVVDEQEYRKRKREDLDEQEQIEQKVLTETELKRKVFRTLKEKNPEMTIKRLAEGFDVSERTGQRWLKDEKGGDVPENEGSKPTTDNYTTNLIINDDDSDEKNEEKDKKIN